MSGRVDTPRSLARGRPRLRTRLTAWYAGVLLAALLATATGIRFAVERTLDRAFTESLEASIAVVQRFFRVEIAEFRTVEATVTHIATELVFEDRVIDVHRPDGTVFLLPGRSEAHGYPQLVPPVRELTAPLDPMLAPGWTIEVHGSEAALAAARERLDIWLLAGIPLVVLAAAVIGWWLAARALQPIGDLVAQANALDAGLRDRLTLNDPTDELGRLGTSFNALLDRLDAALAQQRRFLADAAHELRTPIARLRGRVELARLSLASGEHSPEALRDASAQVLAALDGELRDTSEVVQGLLALARADADADLDAMHDGFLDDALMEELPRWRETATQAGVALAVETFDEVWARFDASLMRRLLALLLDNAIRYTPSGGQVQVHLDRVAAGPHPMAELRVCDTGIGVPEAEREAVFARFHRAADARAWRPDGSGLGLSLAQWIVTRHGGTIGLTSRPDGARGTVVLVRLPCLAPLDAEAGRREAVGGLPGAA